MRLKIDICRDLAIEAMRKFGRYFVIAKAIDECWDCFVLTLRMGLMNRHRVREYLHQALLAAEDGNISDAQRNLRIASETAYDYVPQALSVFEELEQQLAVYANRKRRRDSVLEEA